MAVKNKITIDELCRQKFSILHDLLRETGKTLSNVMKLCKECKRFEDASRSISVDNETTMFVLTRVRDCLIDDAVDFERTMTKIFRQN